MQRAAVLWTMTYLLACPVAHAAPPVLEQSERQALPGASTCSTSIPPWHSACARPCLVMLRAATTWPLPIRPHWRSV
ncbi:hypothetical protein XocBAI15_16535 [Xanthomonas oryzae pv. oryzicola]|nr:hypothetical protein XocBAI15_16535 [Xanthomonas oryzae pv. oryzicola]